MNVRQIRERIERELVHAPDVAPHRNEILDRVNDALQQLVSAHRWPFRYRFREMRLKAEVSLTAAQFTTNAGGNTYAVSFSVPASWDEADELLLAGHLWEFSSPSTGAVTPFVIERASVAAGSFVLILDPRYAGHASLVGDETAKIKFLRYVLPRDCEDVFSLTFRDASDKVVRELTLRQEDGLLLNSDDSPALPDVLLRDPNRSSAYPVSSGQDYPHDFASPPQLAPTLAQAAGGALVVGAVYEYRYAWQYAGLTSPSSPVASTTVLAGSGTINLSGLEVLDSSSLGRTRLIYRRKDEGPWYQIGEILSPTVATFADAGTFTTAVNPTALIREREYLSGGSPWFVRTWPLTDADRAPQLRYLARVPRVDNDGDVPEFPEEFHMALVHMVVMAMAPSADAGRLAAAHERMLHNDEFGVVTLMRRRYLGTSASRHQRRSVLRDESARPAILHGPVTYNG